MPAPFQRTAAPQKYLHIGPKIGPGRRRWFAGGGFAPPDDVGAIIAAFIEPDGWTLRVRINGVSPGAVDHTKVSGAAVPPATDYLGVSMAGVSARTIAGAASNLNFRYDADFPFPDPRLDGLMLEVFVRLNRPVRAAEIVDLNIGADLVAGSLSRNMLATNNSQLRSARYAQDQFGADPKKMIALIDVMNGKLPRLAALANVLDIPIGSGNAINGIYRGNGSGGAQNRVFVGMGTGDTTPRTLAGYDFAAAGDGWYAQINCQNATVRDCKFDDLTPYPIATMNHVNAAALTAAGGQHHGGFGAIDAGMCSQSNREPCRTKHRRLLSRALGRLRLEFDGGLRLGQPRRRGGIEAKSYGRSDREPYGGASDGVRHIRRYADSRPFCASYRRCHGSRLSGDVRCRQCRSFSGGRIYRRAWRSDGGL